jgi:hypothetical protein
VLCDGVNKLSRVCSAGRDGRCRITNSTWPIFVNGIGENSNDPNCCRGRLEIQDEVVADSNDEIINIFTILIKLLDELSSSARRRQRMYRSDAPLYVRVLSALWEWIKLFKRPLDRERRPHCAFGVVLLRHRIAEQRHKPVAELLGDFAAHLCNRLRGSVEVSSDKIASFLDIAEHHRDMTALTGGFGRSILGRNLRGNGRCRKRWDDDGRRLGRCRCAAQLPDCTKHLQPVP